MPKLLTVLCFLVFQLQVLSQNASGIPRPKLVVALVVDQMRWDYLTRYYERYSENGGFKRLLKGGFSCDNTLIPYVPTLTACGHSCIFTGSTPAINGITGNDWWDYRENRFVYCTQDDSTTTIGSNNTSGKMSPRRMRGTTIGDELRLATNFRSKVIGIALKDRGAILSAGHSANAAYWFDVKTGNWVSSSYYLQALPKWVTELNDAKLVDKYFEKGWDLLYPSNTYTASVADEQPYESALFGKKSFPYPLRQFAGARYDLLPVTPFGNSLTFDMARAAIDGEQLGSAGTDMITISLSTPDYIGHNFGPNSVEAEDVFLRLDRDLAAFLDFLDQKYTQAGYLFFLTADHGAGAVPAFLKQNKIPAGHLHTEKLTADLNASLKERFRVNDLVIGVFNGQVFLDRKNLAQTKLEKTLVESYTINYLLQVPGIERAFSLSKLAETNISERIKQAIVEGYFPDRSGDIQIILEPHYLEGLMPVGTSHGSWNPYDAHIPLIWYGWNVKPGRSGRETSMADIAVTLASLLNLQIPAAATGRVIDEVKR